MHQVLYYLQPKIALVAKVEVAGERLAVVHDRKPDLLLVDEPVAGMTGSERTRTGEILMETARALVKDFTQDIGDILIAAIYPITGLAFLNC